MITPELKTLIDEMITQTPDYVRDSLQSFDWLTAIEEVGIKYRLAGGQLNSFVSETAMVVLGVEDPGLFRSNLINHVVINGEIVDFIVEDLGIRVFDPLQKALEEVVGDTPEVLRQKFEEERQLEESVEVGELPAIDSSPRFTISDPSAPPVVTSRKNTEDPYNEPLE